jgi:hypothetical protein
MLEIDPTTATLPSEELSGGHEGGAQAVGPDQGVIEEARRRQRQRRRGYVLGGALVAVLIAALAWALGGGASNASPGDLGRADDALGAVSASEVTPAAFNVRLVPTLAVAQAGWCVVVEEHGVAGGDACGGAALESNPFLQVYGWGRGGSGYDTTVAVSTPSVATVLVDGKLRVTPSALPGLPYGLKAVQIVSRVSRSGGQFQKYATIVALDKHGRKIAEHQGTTGRQGNVRSWRAPARAPRGVCGLSEAGVPGLTTGGGQVASTIRAYPGTLVGDAFVSCIDTEYRLQGVPIDAEILLDAAHPGAPVAALPDWKPVPGAPGFFSEGGLTARRTADGWLLVRQGSGLAERMRLLRHLSATVAL